MKWVWIIACVAIVAGICVYILLKNKKKHPDSGERYDLTGTSGELSACGSSAHELAIQFENLPVLTESEESRIVEVKDKKLLARIDNVIPGTFQAVANTGAVKAYEEAVKATGQLYQAIIPKGAVLDKSRAMEGAVRGSYRDVANSIKGNANWVSVDNQAANTLAKVNVVNAAMGAAAMVVGQYYMTQINDQLQGLSAAVEKIADFQSNQLKSKVYALVAEAQKSSIFQVETIENDELRNRELIHLKELEHECIEILGQANLALKDIAKCNGLDYDGYEGKTKEAEQWLQYQQILLEVMYKICDLTYALNLGAISKENRLFRGDSG